MAHPTTQTAWDYLIERVGHGTLKQPTTEDALLFAITEVSEAIEVHMGNKGYVRNNPETKPKFTREGFARELGDAIFMLLVAGITAGVDPISAMISKMEEYDARDFQE